MKKLLLILLCLPIIIMSQNIKYSKAQIYYKNQAEYNLLKIKGVVLDHVKMKKNVFIESDFSSVDISVAKQLGFKVNVLIDDVQEYYINRNLLDISSDKAPNNSCSNSNSNYTTPANYNHGSMGGYLTYNQVMSEIDSMAILFPNIITVRSSISTFTTHEGRSLYWVKISDNPNIDENEPEILYDAVHHAREPMSIQQLIYYMWYLLENYSSNSEVQTIIDNTELYFVPFVNPDGFIHNETTNPNGGGMWRKNRRNHLNGDFGVDNNRNYNYIDGTNGSVWGTNGISFNTYSDVYCGTNAFSEPENQAMKWFVEQHEFRLTLNNHSYSHLLLYPFGFDVNQYSSDHNTYFAISNLMTSSNNMDSQLAWELYPASGNSDDFMYGDTIGHGKIFSFTPEIGTGLQGFWPASSDIDPLCRSMMPLNLMAAHLVGNYAETTDKHSVSFVSVSGFILYDITRYGLQSPANFTVSIFPISNNIQNIGSPNQYNNMSILQTNLDSISYSLSANISPGDVIEYVIVLNNGLYSFNDTISKVYGAPQLIYSNNGSSISGWSNQFSWGTTSSAFQSSPSSITDSPFGNYSNNTNNKISLSNSVSLNNSFAAYASFWAKWDIEDNWDYVQFEVSDDNGNSWTPQCGIYTEEGAVDQDIGQPVYDGLQSNWIKEIIDLSDYLNQDILVRFKIITDGANTSDGFYFDDFEINVIFNTVLGCTDSSACNYDPAATINNNICDYSSASFDTIIANNNYNWLGVVYNVSGDYIDTLVNSVGCDSIANLNLTITNTTGIVDVINNKSILVKITDILGQVIPYRENTLLFYIFDDGTFEKKIILE